MDDQNSVQIRECGINVIGKKLLFASECIDENDPSLKALTENFSSSESDFKLSIKQILREIQQTALVLLRFLYSVQKNKKLFKLVFPPEIFGPFIDIGNYERDRRKYKLVKKIDRLPDSAKATIMSNFEKCEMYQAKLENQKIINGYRVIDIIGKGAFGVVYEVEKDDMRYAMKEIHIAQYDQTYDHKMHKEEIEENKDIDKLVTDNISKEVTILKSLDHPNIVKFYTSFAEEDFVYIIMELHEGLSLTDYIQSLSEKKQRVKEEVVWNIFLQL